MAATAAIAGRKGFLSLSSVSSTAATTNIGALENWTINQNRPTIDATSFDSSGYEENIGGIFGYTLSATLFSYSSNAGQVKARKAITATSPTKLFFVAYPTTAATFKYTGGGYVQDVSIKGGTKDAVMFDFTLKGTGKLTLTT